MSNAAGAADAANVRITDTLPDGVTLDGPLPTDCTSSTETSGRITVTCGLGTIAAGQEVRRTINVIAPGTPGTLENGARTTSPTDPTPDDSNVEQTTVIAEVDLSLNKTDSRDPVPVSSGFAYTLEVANAIGAGTATGVQVKDTLPNGVMLSGSLPASCTSTRTKPVTVTCELGTVDAGEIVSKDINVTAPGTPGTLSNTATVSTSNDPTNGSDTEETTVNPVPPTPPGGSSGNTPPGGGGGSSTPHLPTILRRAAAVRWRVVSSLLVPAGMTP